MFHISYYMVIACKTSKTSLLESARQGWNAEITRNEKGQRTIFSNLFKVFGFFFSPSSVRFISFHFMFLVLFAVCFLLFCFIDQSYKSESVGVADCSTCFFHDL